MIPLGNDNRDWWSQLDDSKVSNLKYKALFEHLQLGLHNHHSDQVVLILFMYKKYYAQAII